MPLYGESSKREVIALLLEKMNAQGEQPYDLHLDVYEMREESLHVVLFELVVLRKLHVGLKSVVTIPKGMHIYIEVANVFNDKLRRSLSYLDLFNHTVELKGIIPEEIRIPTDAGSLE